MLRNWALAILSLLLGATPALAGHHHRKPRVPEIVALPCSHENLVAQNQEADRLGLHIIRTQSALHEMVQDGELVPLVPGAGLRVHIPAGRSYAAPWVAAFINQLAEDYHAATGQPLQVNSATRPYTVQRSIRRWNRNAAPLAGDVASVHMRGIAVDIQRRGLSLGQRQWLQMRLLYYVAIGRVLCEEEVQQPCFHIVPRGPGYEPALQPVAVALPAYLLTETYD